ncbi:LCP family protein [Psychrobacillus sp. OK032]|uniref:LCP family protein n=1 Tax=Psychrobacillus sp. OK032 TaxID=1884358 RepID=UPI0008AEFE2B|nr:LCP family protein [Psychrobacillus sp. OK032]SES07602.1 transcriptional attenuator, LytR family [Psychrobacillus sp. OK032]
MVNSRSTNRKTKKKRKALYITLIISMLLLSGVFVFAINLSIETKNAASKMYKALDRDKEKDNSNFDNVKAEDSPFTILLAGIEREEGEKYGRSDMLILATVNPKAKKISMVNIPRDTRVFIEKLGMEDKINHAYSNGGMDYTINTMENLLDIPIDYYVSTDFQGFEDIVDTVGGIDVEVPFPFKAQLTGSLKWKTYTKGTMFLNGNEALAYVRMRKNDLEGDKGRNTRQKQVIQEIITKATSISNITKVDDMMIEVGENVRTNIPSSEYIGLLKMYQTIKSSPIEQLQLDGTNQKVYSELEKKKVWYFYPDEESLNKLKETLILNLDNFGQNAQSEKSTTTGVEDLSIGK